MYRKRPKLTQRQERLPVYGFCWREEVRGMREETRVLDQLLVFLQTETQESGF